MRKRTILPLVAALLFLLPIPVPADAADRPRAIVERLNDMLLQVMKNAAQLEFQGRYDVLAPLLERSFAFAEMTRIAAGQHWSRLDQTQRDRLVERFTQMSIATFAARFDGYSGERFEILGEDEMPRGRALVRSRIVRPSSETVPLNYVFADVNGDWRIVDVYLKGTISELATYRSEFVSVLGREGFDELIRRIDDKIAKLRS